MTQTSSLAPLVRPWAFISDVHGNLDALNAVVADWSDDYPERIYVAGDILLGGDKPLDVWRRLQTLGAHMVKGVTDIALASLDVRKVVPAEPQERKRLEDFLRTREALGELVLAQLRKLPEQLRVPLVSGHELVVAHGSPGDPYTELTHDLSDDELIALLHDDPADVFVCGSSHVPFERTIGELSIVNVGSVGNAPEGAYAHYTLIYAESGGVRIDQRVVEYTYAA